VDSSAPAQWLSDERNSSCCRGEHSAGQEDTRIAASYLGTWVVLFIYGPILIAQMSTTSTAVKVEGID
jgi:hypothetical protein